jgi:hypothetical protein
MKYIKITVLAGVALLLFATTACRENESKGDGPKPTADSTSIIAADTVADINLDHPDAQEKLLLVFNPEPGKTYYYTNTSSYLAYSKQDSFEMKANSSKSVKMKMHVKEKNKEDQFIIEFTLTDVAKTIKSDSARLDYQYGKAMTDKEQDIDRRIEDCLVNSPIILTMNTSGEALDMSGYEVIIAKMKAIIETESGQKVPDEYIAQQMSLPTENIDNLFIMFPDTAVRIGESWDFISNSELQGMPILIESTYILADRKDGVATINLSSIVSVDKSRLPKEIVEQMGNLKVNSHMNGFIRIEEKTGWPVYMKLSQFVEISDSYMGINTYSRETGNTMITLSN